MADYSEDDSRYATRIVERLVSREAENLELEPDVVVSDLESDAVAFSDDLSILEEFDANMPAMFVAGEPVPVSLDFAIGGSDRGPSFPFLGLRRARPWRGHPFFHEFFYEYLRPILREERQFDGFTSMNREKARTTFVRGASDFLATRIAAVRRFRNADRGSVWHRPSLLSFRQRLRGPQVPTPGCNFTVTTNSIGLRVFWSGAYRVSPNYFNHPTSPTSSVLQSGTYVFGVDGGAYGNNIQWDHNCVVSLPGLPHAQLNF